MTSVSTDELAPGDTVRLHWGEVRTVAYVGPYGGLGTEYRVIRWAPTATHWAGSATSCPASDLWDSVG